MARLIENHFCSWCSWRLYLIMKPSFNYFQFISTSSSGTSYEGNVRKRRRIHSGVRIIVSLDKAEICGDKLLEQITYLYPKIKSSTRILDVGVSNQTFFNEILNPVFFLRLIDSLLDSQNALDQGNHLIIVGFPLLTRKVHITLCTSYYSTKYRNLAGCCGNHNHYKMSTKSPSQTF